MIVLALSDMFGEPIKNPTVTEVEVDADDWHKWLTKRDAHLVGWNPDFNKGPEQIGEQPKVDEFAQQWPDTIPWGDEEQDYYRNAKTSIVDAPASTPPAIVQQAPAQEAEAPAGVRVPTMQQQQLPQPGQYPTPAGNTDNFIYSYKGSINASSAILSLDSADIKSGHVAVWLGVSNQAAWLQAGIEVSKDQDQPVLYLEWSNSGHSNYFPIKHMSFGEKARITLKKLRGDTWSIIVNGRAYGPVYVGGTQNVYATGESWYDPSQPNHYTFGIQTLRYSANNVVKFPLGELKFRRLQGTVVVVGNENGMIYYQEEGHPNRTYVMPEEQYQDFIQRGVWTRIGQWTKWAESDTMDGVNPTDALDQQVQNDPAAATALQALTAAGGQVYVVGGAVRDTLMGGKPKDIDLMVQGLDPEQIQAALSPLGRLDFTGAAFGVFRFRKAGDDVEIALPRLERSTGTGHKDFEINADPYLPAEEDLRRRDFTINAMAYHPASGQIIDPHGGRDDLANGRLALVNQNAFNDDPLRIVRALVATARYGFEPDPQLLEAMSHQASAIRHLPGERIQMEMDKLMSSPNPAAAMEMAEQTGVLDYLAPEVSSTVGFSQWNPHHDLDVWEHTLQVLRAASQLSNDPDVRLAALFHDSGKPDSFWRDPDAPEGGGGHFYKKKLDDGSFIGEDHEEVGGDLVREYMQRLRYPTKRIERVEFLVRNHMFPYFDTPKGARKFLKRCGGDAKLAFDLLALRQADASGKREGTMNDFDTEQVQKARALVQEALEKEEPTSTKALAINGNDLIQMGMKPGPEIGRTLNRLLEEVMDNPELNNRDDLLRLVNA
jgi:tRNA nucleotidyltransferase (CCA-adding enzyme)